MNKIILISGPTCNRCHFIKPPLQARAEKNNYTFEEIDISNADTSLIEWATMLPVIWINDKQISYEEAIDLITKS